MKDFTRRNFLKLGAAGTAGLATVLNFPVLGRRLALACPGSNFFTIAVISDTQNYVDFTHTQPFNEEFFISQAQYLADHRDELNLAFVSHVGDVVQHGDGTNGTPGDDSYGAGAEWVSAVKAMDILDATGVPFGMTIGNHDYDNMFHLAPSAYPPLVSTAPWWKTYFGSGSKYFRHKPWYGGASDHVGYISTGAAGSAGMWPPAGTPCNYGLSSYQFFRAAGRKFLHISLEMEAGNNAIAWAQKVLDSHPGLATILTTHSYESPPAWGDNNLPLVEPAARNTASFLVNSPSGWNDATTVWNNLIAPNDQIFMVLCGHSWTSTENGVSKGENIRIDKNNAGHNVYQVLSDYQGNTTLGSGGGDGWYRFMQFDMDSNHIHFTTYDTYVNQYAGQSIDSSGLSNFEQPKGFSDFSLPMPVQVLKAIRCPEDEDFSRAG